jgi:hypothetical protein
MPSLAETGDRIGIPEDDLAELIELPVVAQALQTAAENPNWAPNSIWRGVGRPTLFTDTKGLDIESLRVELVKRRELATRTTDGKIVPERFGSPVSTGRLQKAQNIARRRLEVIYEVATLLEKHPHEPQSMAKARNYLGSELEKARQGGEL